MKQTANVSWCDWDAAGVAMTPFASLPAPAAEDANATSQPKERTMKKIGGVAALLTATTLLGVAGAATADPGPTPNGLTGAANMVNANAASGMANAMSRDNANGNAGMFCAVFTTSGVTAPGSCR
jgi:hypothetical protein